MIMDKQDDERRHDQDAGNGSDAAQGEEKMPAEAGQGEPTRSRLTFRPRADIIETDRGLVLVADLPGAKPEKVDVSLERRELTIRAEVEESLPEGMSPLYQEYRVGDFERRFSLTGDFDFDGIEAEFRNGTLRLSIPRAAAPEARKIELKAG
jgi:HSP20 family molecular chaperone IbpA